MYLTLYFLAAEALIASRSILYIQSAEDGKYLNLSGNFEDFEEIKHQFQSELKTEKGEPPYMKIRNGENRYLSVKDNTLIWTNEDLGLKWYSTFVKTNEVMLSEQNGKCFAREGSQITMKSCEDIENDDDVSHFKLLLAPTPQEIKHARSVLKENKEQSRMLSRENNNARRGEGRSMSGTRSGISDSLTCPMRKLPDGGLDPESPGRYGKDDSSPDNLLRNWVENDYTPERDAKVPPRGVESTPQGRVLLEGPAKDRDLDSTPRSSTCRALERERGNSGDPYSVQDYTKALNIARRYAEDQAGQNTMPLSKADEHDEISSDPIKALNDLKKMLEKNQRKVLSEAVKQKEKVKNDVDKKREEVLKQLLDDISKLQREKEGRMIRHAAVSMGDGRFPVESSEDKHNNDQYNDLKMIKETLQKLQEQLDPLLRRER